MQMVCYTQKTYKDCDMNLDTAKALVDISIENGIKNFKLIGGEPTLYPYFFEILEHLMQSNIRCFQGMTVVYVIAIATAHIVIAIVINLWIIYRKFIP